MVPQNGVPVANSMIDQMTQTATTAIRRHNGRKKGCSESFIGPIYSSMPRREPVVSDIGKALCLDRVAGRRHHPHQFLVADLGHPERRVLFRILLGLDHEPALIAMVGEPLHD